MKGLLVCALVLALGLVNGDGPCVCNYGHHRSSRGCSALQGKVDSQTARISRLSGHIQALQQKLDDGKSKREAIVLQQADITTRLSELEVHHCTENEFHCGENDNICISKLVVCDGVNDCAHGADEDKQRCNNPASSGSSFYAEIHEDPDLCTTRRLKSIRLDITSVRQLNWFPSRTLIEANVVLDHSDDDAHHVDTLHTKGYYDYSHTRLVLDPPEDDGLGIVCDFDGVDPDHCHGHIVREASLNRCLDFHATRK